MENRDAAEHQRQKCTTAGDPSGLHNAYFQKALRRTEPAGEPEGDER